MCSSKKGVALKLCLHCPVLVSLMSVISSFIANQSLLIF